MKVIISIILSFAFMQGNEILDYIKNDTKVDMLCLEIY